MSHEREETSLKGDLEQRFALEDVFASGQGVVTISSDMPNGGQWGIPRESDVATYESWEALTFSRLSATVH